MEALSDGVMAFAATLLVVDVAVRPPGSPTEQFLRGWPSYLAYLVSFLTIGAVWFAHQALTDRLERVDSIYLRINLLFLLTIAFLPFPTRLVVDALDKSWAWQRLAVVLYGTTVLMIRLLFAAMVWYVGRERLREAGADDPDLQDARKKFGYFVAASLLTIGVGLVYPPVAIFLYLATALYVFIPFGTLIRAVRGRPTS